MTEQAKPQSPTKQLTPYEAFKNDLANMANQFKPILPDHITPEKFTRVLLTAAQTSPLIVTADRRLLWGEVMKCAQDGLLPDGREAVINVYRAKDGPGTPKYIPMVGGICKKVRNSGEIKSIDAVVVYQNDTYESWVDEKGQHFKHIKARIDRGEPVLTYAYAIAGDGGFYFEEIDEKQMSAIQASSRADSGPWKGAFKDEMRRKSAIRRLAKYRIPSSADIDEVLHRDDDLFDLNKDIVKPEPEPVAPKTSRLEKIVDAQSQTVSSTATIPAAEVVRGNEETPI